MTPRAQATSGLSSTTLLLAGAVLMRPVTGTFGESTPPGERRATPTHEAPGRACGLACEAPRALHAPGLSSPAAVAQSAPAPRILQLAIDADFEFRQLFASTEEAIAYIHALYGEVSNIYEREINLRIELSYVRVWEEEDPFGQEEPLVPFKNYWNENMGFVERDIAQLLSARRDLPWGGIAWLSATCGNFGYSVVGYVLGWFPDPSAPHPYAYDIAVTAHEIGHNLGARHSHDYGVNDCQMLVNTPRRGTIMSYCAQSVSGGNGNTDLRFHVTERQAMLDHLADSPCLITDCNFNGIADSQEIAGGAPDLNGDGILDACQDCDGDGMLDPQAIQLGLVTDFDFNGIPDACDPDCNGNGLCDGADIALGLSQDLWGDAVPDECDEDADGDLISDYNQILAQMTLDLDRDVRLDAVEDCDDDGITDRATVDGAGAVIAVSRHDALVRRFDARAGTTEIASSLPAGAQPARDLVVDPATSHSFVSSGSRVMECDRSGNYVRDVIATDSIIEAAGLALTGDGSILIADHGGNQVVRADLLTGSMAWNAPVAAPHGAAIGPDGLLYVTSDPDTIVRLDPITGASHGEFIAPGNGILLSPRAMAFRADGVLLVTSTATDQVHAFEPITGAWLGQFNHNGTESALTLDEPWGIRVGPGGNVFVSRRGVYAPGAAEAEEFLHPPLDPEEGEALHVNASRLYEFDGATGDFVRSFITGHDTGWWQPAGFDFLPVDGDCNRNGVPDGCEIAADALPDLDGDGIPDLCDECPLDLDGDDRVGLFELVTVLNHWGTPGPGDFDQSGAVAFGDIVIVLEAWGDC